MRAGYLNRIAAHVCQVGRPMSMSWCSARPAWRVADLVGDLPIPCAQQPA